METLIRRLRIHFLSAQLELRRLKCTSLALEFEKTALSDQQKALLFRQWEATLKESHHLRFQLEQQQREDKLAALCVEGARGVEGATFSTWFFRAKG